MSTGIDPAAHDTGTDVRTLLRGIALLLVVVVLVALGVNGSWLAVAAGCSLASMLGYVVALRGAFDSIVPLRVAIRLGFAEQGTNVLLPAGGAGGPAFGTAVMRRAGVPTGIASERHVVLFLVTSGVSFAGLAVSGVVTALTGDVTIAASLIPAAIGVLVLSTAIAFARLGEPSSTVPPSNPARLIWRLRRFLHTGVRTSLVLMRRGDPSLLSGAVAYYAFDIAALGASFQAFGGDGPPLALFVLSYTIGHAGALIPTPGGVGGTDGGLIGAFALYGTPIDVATAAVLGYRVFQRGLPVVLGTISVFRIQYTLRHGPQPEEVAAAFEAAQAERATDRR